MQTARGLYVHNALIPYIEFVREQSERKTGNGLEVTKVIAIADALLNLPDYLIRRKPVHPELATFRDARSYRESLWRQNPEYEIACDMANSQKHLFVTRENRKIDGIDEVKESYALCRYKDSDGIYYRTIKAVVIHAKNGKKYPATRILRSAVRLWADELFRLSVTPRTPDRIFQSSEFIEREDARFTEPLLLLGIAGEPIEFDPILLEYSDEEEGLVHAQSKFDGKACLSFEIRPSPFDP